MKKIRISVMTLLAISIMCAALPAFAKDDDLRAPSLSVVSGKDDDLRAPSLSADDAVAPTKFSQADEGAPLSPGSYEITDALKTLSTTAIGEGMSIFYESLAKKPRAEFVRDCSRHLRLDLFDIHLITDKKLDVKPMSDALKSWEFLGQQMDQATGTLNDLIKELAKPDEQIDWLKVKAMSSSICDTLMESEDPRQAVIEGK